MTQTASLRPSRRALIAGAGVMLAAPALLAGAPATQRLTGRAFGSGWAITLPDAAPLAGLHAAVDDVLAGIDRQMSPWRADSDITALNMAGAGPRDLPGDTAQVLAAALRLAHDSGGAFDPTVGPLVARWGFGPIRQGDPQPDWRHLTLTGQTVTKATPGATADLCGIAKGHALDRLAALMAGRGAHWLIDLGGELAAGGQHPLGRAWQVAIEGSPGAAAEVLALRGGMAVATSGSGVNGYDLGGRRVSHIIDPASGTPAQGGLAQVSVIARSARFADGWATALFAAGEARALDMARQHGLTTLMLTADGRRLETGDLAAHLA
ncbi:MAG: FAD:protein FMN transferase [Paracoccus sp. (in: a-proteobacteria)]|uniref:FAD:protein FMN transferase n=1 Tax=Paracoccus sp. TaxID=267 RepID=UPI0026E0F4D2|nr:FAD:protein FMN transferase [Paracoccus sp. (in: a-proteobacteria)]MDO5611781.1 FAD:protein FMN transferase [Paracoccus sp. (in: a-proteobacteria)]